MIAMDPSTTSRVTRRVPQVEQELYPSVLSQFSPSKCQFCYLSSKLTKFEPKTYCEKGVDTKNYRLYVVLLILIVRVVNPATILQYLAVIYVIILTSIVRVVNPTTILQYLVVIYVITYHNLDVVLKF